MVLEATMIIVDNSEQSRNGDYIPTRWEAQAEAVNIIFSAKTQANPESSVGLMSMGGSGPEVLVTLTTDLGKILDGIHRTKIKGNMHLATGIRVAYLALKHRQNTTQKKRIIVFACSEIQEQEPELIKLAKVMRKENVSVDIIAFGDLDPSNTKKLETFSENCKSPQGSHLAIIPPSANLLSDQILSTPILQGDGAVPRSGGNDMGSGSGGGGGGGGDAGGFEFGVDPNADPELALALRMSMEEENARQEKERKEREKAAQKESLEGIPEEQQPLLNGGEASGSGDQDEDGKSKDKDHMDTS